MPPGPIPPPSLIGPSYAACLPYREALRHASDPCPGRAAMIVFGCLLLLALFAYLLYALIRPERF
ncbi:K(+)-transporting ATPase subunit F [Luteibacter sp.]|uniref:K(+)-transporting ATPase subunit F n=1 Tax=Luteibacter sp. TaxID=1886636 RepID=UPI0039C95DBD